VSFILNIDSAVEGASICLADNAQPIASKANPSQKDSASWLHIAIDQLLKEQNISPKQLEAIAVSSGPGSYTGLRVGMSAAKGLCYALGIPLISINTLQMMANAAKSVAGEGFLCPMIDARRMEVFTAVFDKELNELSSPTNVILSHSFCENFLEQGVVYFFGNGSSKFQNLCNHENAKFFFLNAEAENMSELTFEKFSRRDFCDLAYSEPYYGKEFHTPGPAK
jgi:tRNA threonylcarbamoyladenosine biosynthesis protein TsaB